MDKFVISESDSTSLKSESYPLLASKTYAVTKVESTKRVPV
jgi:hypothetical protein